MPVTPITCLGIDLAWSWRNPSGAAALSCGPEGCHVLALEHLLEDAALVAFVARHRGAASVLMVDAPLRVPNASGRRPCEALVQARFGGRQAAAYPSNRGLFARWGGVRGERLVAQLAPLGVREASLDAAGTGHTVFECYPHAALVALGRLPRSLKYKRKSQPWPEARAAFRQAVELLAAQDDPPISLPASLRAELDPGAWRGRAYKAREDRLDALVCAYVAALALRGRLEMLGTVSEGHIVVPREAA
ncbi:MAG: DUF429 domain-containing protein [Gemmatimonadales bacterium]|jgi:predicted RNase H-like nuclease|nr:DUF429 domain-containing protein [Gemmatimonadales bacterium]